MNRNTRRRWIAASMLSGALAYASGPSFRPDVKVAGTSLDGWHPFGQAEWKAEKGEIIGKPNQSGGWLVLDKSYQDILFYSEYKCTGGCVTGLLLRAEKTPDGGMTGVYVSLSDTTSDMENLSGYDVTIDAQGKIVSATQEQRGGGFMRVVSPWPPKPQPQRAPGGDGGMGGFRRESTVDLPIHPPDTRYRPNDWNSVEFSFDANVVRVNLNDGGQG
ncbi:MAG: family 16 glycoside hydrolase, partial [Terracidiphilus sp.]